MILATAKNLQGKEIRIEGNNCVYNNSNPNLKTEVGEYSKVTYYNSAVYLDESRHYLYFYGLTTNSGVNNFSVYVDNQLLWDTRYTLGTGTCCFNTYQRFNASISWPSFQTFIMTTTVGGCTGIVDYTGVVKAFTNRNECYAYMTSTVDPGATVKVNYYLPDDTYTYSKLTYNSEHEPEDKDDGTSIDILPSNTSVNVEGLEEDTLYYFTIFTNKSESEPFPFSVV